MKIFDLLKLAILNLYRRLSRTLLTVIGVIIGTTCIVIMFSIGLTNIAQFEEMIQSAQLTKIEVREMRSNLKNNVRLDDAAVLAFSKIHNVDMVIPQKQINMYAEIDKYNAPYLSVTAVPSDILKKFISLEQGRYINPNSLMPEIVMGNGAKRFFLESEDNYIKDYKGPDIDFLDLPLNMYLGSKNFIENQSMPSSRMYKANIVGFIKGKDPEYPNGDVYMSLNVAKRIIQENYKLANEMNLKINTYDKVLIYANNMESVTSILKIIRSYGFDGYSNTEWIEEMQKQQKAQQGQLASIGLISLLVSAIGIANTMMTGILERKKEIGVMKVIGMPISKIRILFLIESSLLGMLGGLIGILISHIFGYLIAIGGNDTKVLGMYFGAGMRLVIPIWLDLTAIGISILVGVLAGIFPANKAVKMSPLEAIRS